MVHFCLRYYFIRFSPLSLARRNCNFPQVRNNLAIPSDCFTFSPSTLSQYTTLTHLFHYFQLFKNICNNVIDSTCTVTNSNYNVLDSKRSSLHSTRTVIDSNRSAMNSTRTVVDDLTLPTNYTPVSSLLPFPTYALPFHLHCIAGIDFTFHPILWENHTTWVNSILPLL